MENLTREEKRYLKLLAEKYPSVQDVCTEIINLKAIRNLPKGTEHFMSDLHGEYEAFYHILNNCSGVIKEKVDSLFAEKLDAKKRSQLCTLIYYPAEKLTILKEEGRLTNEWYRDTLQNMNDLAKMLSSKYTRSKVRKAMPEQYRYILDELLHMQKDEDDNQVMYHEKIIDSLIQLKSCDDVIEAMATLIKKLAVDHLHIVGDIFDRGARPDAILDMLMDYHHPLDFEWGNHDVLWMGAAAGNLACIATVVRNSLSYHNMDVLEKGYGISLRPLALFAEHIYGVKDSDTQAPLLAISMILFKLEGQLIKAHPEYNMRDRLLLEQIDYEKKVMTINGTAYKLKEMDFPTVDHNDPYRLTEEEERLMQEFAAAFRESYRLNAHIQFIYEKGSIYRCYNGNLLFHGCIPLKESGRFASVCFEGKEYSGKSYMEYADHMVRKAYYTEDQNALDFMWYLWCGKESPIAGRIMKTVERMLLEDESTWEEPRNPYYDYCNQEATCRKILDEFGLLGRHCHIINGHTPVKVAKGESPIKANGLLFVIDGGFCRAYQKTTGIAGYTLIYNSHGLRLKAHQPFSTKEKALEENADIESDSQFIETFEHRMMIEDTDTGEDLDNRIQDLEQLLMAYRRGYIMPSMK